MRTLPPLPRWVAFEHEVAAILTQQEQHGWYFNERAAWELESSLRKEYEETCELLRNRHPYVKGPVFTPKRNNQTKGYVEGTGVVKHEEWDYNDTHYSEDVQECSFTKLKDLNPTSRDHIAWILKTHYGWMPTSTTSKTDKPIVNEITLKEFGKDIALQFLRLLDLTKQLGMISEGVNAWQKLSTTAKRIHHHCSVATSTYRCAHRKPNLSQVPSDERFRKLFTASPNMVMCGADLSGIELRILSHYLAKYDAGRYKEILINGDIHQTNADRIGITRRQVKTVTYAFLYGAGDRKIGHSYDKQLSDEKAVKKGREIRKAYVEAIPGLKELLESLREVCKNRKNNPYVLAIDSRRIKVDKEHKVLNYLLQGSAACVAKMWMVIVHKNLLSNCHQLAFVHDELQYECPQYRVKELKALLELSAIQAGEYYNLRCPIAAEAKSGHNWADVH